jgi:hypothetical protein
MIQLDMISRPWNIDDNPENPCDPQMRISGGLMWNGDAAILQMEGLEAQTSFMVRRNALAGTTLD